jgi:GNAT superfamily N-acetyltransferase
MYPRPVEVSTLDADALVELRDGRKVYIVPDDDMDRVDVFDVQGAPIGAFHFVMIDEGDEYWHHLTWQYLDAQDGYRRCGIGQKILETVIDRWDTRITAGENNGNKSSMGDQLEGDGAPFVARMREKGLIARSSYDPVPEAEWGDE